MKISVKLLLITFAVVVLISGASAVIYYSLSNSILESQNSKSVINSTTDLAGSLQRLLEKMDEEGTRFSLGQGSADRNLKGFETDFFFRLSNDSLIDFSFFLANDTVFLNRSSRSIKNFVRQNRNLIYRAGQGKGNTTHFYGKAVTERLLNRIAEEIRAEVAFVVNDNIMELSNQLKNAEYYDLLMKSYEMLRMKNNYDLYREHLEDSDFICSKYEPKLLSVSEDRIGFLVFYNNIESWEFRSTIKMVIIIIISSGIALALILILLFTTRIRKQIFFLTESAEITAKGNLGHRVPVITKDEIGKLGESFNKMLNDLEKIKYTEKEYLDFLTLLNQSPSLKEISEAVLNKIIQSTNLAFGTIYLVNGTEMKEISSHGLGEGIAQPVQSAKFYSKVIEEKKEIEFVFSENYPEIRTGLAYIKLKYLLIFPIVFNKEVVSIIEVASENAPSLDVKKYLWNIHDQLAIGIMNAKSHSQLEVYIEELKTLNEEYQKQNIQITGQNEKLLELSSQLREKAEELEEKRNQAVRLTMVKSQFLANMSHELKTPLISIIGLSDLSLKEQFADNKIKERLLVINRNGKKLLTMINNILEYSKFETGNIEVKKEVFLLNELIEEIRESINPIAREKGLLFAVRNAKGEALVLSDKALLERILLNLLFNAIKFTEKGSIELAINYLENGGAEFAVSDTGIGISDDNLKIIFDEFKQVEEGSTKKYSGAGLGLAISRKYVEMLEGKISVKSKIGVGTKFKVVLPQFVVELVPGEFQPEHKDSSMPEENKTRSVALVSSGDNTKRLITDYLANYNINLLHIRQLKELKKQTVNSLNALFVDISGAEPGLWKALAGIKKANPRLSILLMRMIENMKIGYGMFVDDFLFGQVDIETLNRIRKGMNGKYSRNLGIIGKGREEEWESIINKDNGLAYIEYPGIENITGALAGGKFGGLIVDLMEPEDNSIGLIYRLRKNIETRNYKIYLSIPDEITDEIAQMLYREIDEVAVKARYHPMDVLKVIRDKMGLTEEGENIEIDSEPSLPADENEKNEVYEKTIMIVDDDNDTLFTIGELVTGVGFNALYARNGIECLSILEKSRPDLILLDIMMPHMDGFETIRRIRANEKLKNIPVAALTAYAMLDNSEVISKNGFNGLITKPIDSKNLAFKIEKLLTEANEKNISN